MKTKEITVADEEVAVMDVVLDMVRVKVVVVKMPPGNDATTMERLII